MAYATQAAIEARYPGWLALAGPINETTRALDTVAVGLACAAADAPINRALLTIGWSVPVAAPLPDGLLHLAVDIAAYFATSTALASIDMLNDRRQRYDDALRVLADIAAGKVCPSPPVGSVASGVFVTSQPRQFGGEILEAVLKNKSFNYRHLATVRLSMAIRIIFSAVVIRISKSFASRRKWPSHAKVLSTIHRFGITLEAVLKKLFIV